MIMSKIKNIEPFIRINTLSASIILASLILLLSGCGGGGSGSDAPSDSMQGVFLDSPVAGISYETETHSGTTDANGSFFYMDGETIRFMLSDVFMGQAPAASVMTPIDIVPGATNSTHPTVTNMIRFMQTLDIDNNPNNGITITQQVRNELQGRMINFNQGIHEFEHDPDVVMFMDTLNTMNMFGDHREMVPVEQARDHMDETMGGDNHLGSGPPRGHMPTN